MSYHLPPPGNQTAINQLCSPSPPSGTMDPAVRESIYATDLRLQQRSIDNEPEGQGVVFGRGSRRTR
jgi:hypothetical protein